MKQKGICMKRIIYITIACAFLSVSFAKAQVLTLKECLEEGLQNNYSLRIIHNEEQISKNNATLGTTESTIRQLMSVLTSTGLFSTDSISVPPTNS